MLGNSFRPWGSLAWVLDRLPPSHWHLLACLATEPRCLSARRFLNLRGQLQSEQTVRIFDDDDTMPSRFYHETRRLLSVRQEQFVEEGGDESLIDDHFLFDSDDAVVQIARHCLEVAGPDIIFDLSCFPKRFFFPLIKVLYAATAPQNILATYAIPASYADDEPLAEDARPRQYIHSMFMPPDPEPKERVHLVGVGYESFGLPQFLEGEQDFQLLFPFPSPPPGFKRNLEFVRELSPYMGKNVPIVVNTYDVPETFDRIVALTNNGARYAVLSPYGPKPMSLAMCLYACSDKSARNRPGVFYTQPTVYNPRYSDGVATERGQDKIITYCLRLGGRRLY